MEKIYVEPPVHQNVDVPTNLNQTTREPRHFKSRARETRDLITDKFVNWQTLIVIFALTFLFVIFHAIQMSGSPAVVIVVMECIMLVVVWMKVYQIVYDFKLLFLFKTNFGSTFDFPTDQAYPVVTFVIPSYNEPFEVAKMTFTSIIDTPYGGKKEIIVVDNSKDILSTDFVRWKEYVENFEFLHGEENVSVKFIHNKRQDTLKPGNLDLAEKFIDEGEFVVIVDVDSTLPCNDKILEKAIAEFLLDPQLGFLQFKMKATNHHFNDLTQAVASSQDLHRLRLTGRGFGGFKIFEGHNGMWRRSVLESVGTWTDYYRGNIMITEDILKSAQVYSRGFYGKSLNVETGEWIPSSLNALESMWMRWTYGTSQVLFKYFKNIYRSKATIVEKFDVSYHVMHHFTSGFILPFMILLQLTFHGIVTNSFLLVVYFIPQLVGAITIYWRSIRNLKASLFKKIQYLYHGYFLIDTFIMSTQLRASINFLFGVNQGWKITEKGVEQSLSWRNIIIRNIYHLIVGTTLIGISAFSWTYFFNMEWSYIFRVFLPAFIGVNLIVSVLTFGKVGRKEHNQVKSATIDAL